MHHPLAAILGLHHRAHQLRVRVRQGQALPLITLPGVNPNPNPIPNPTLRRRNRLGHDKSNKLVALFHNLRLLKKMRKLLYSEPCVGWNEEEEKTGAS